MHAVWDWKHQKKKRMKSDVKVLLIKKMQCMSILFRQRLAFERKNLGIISSRGNIMCQEKKKERKKYIFYTYLILMLNNNIVTKKELFLDYLYLVHLRCYPVTDFSLDDCCSSCYYNARSK